MPEIGRMLVLLGAVVVVVGLVLMLAPHVPWLGRLPGDVVVTRERFTVYFPIVTCLVVSVVLTLLLNLFFRN
ncbi:MAG TPA: DUF2905 domain-containing protein [Candidatus Limnocylindria bacterium]|nr:DUF2905 domain-containing protein [Candidatus Limnocylindria bacterium]